MHLAKANVATAVASGVLDVGKTVYDYAKGDISTEVAAERLGTDRDRNSFRPLCRRRCGSHIWARGGGSWIDRGGILLRATVYQSCMDVLKDARSTEEESDRVAALCFEAVEAMEGQRADFEKGAAALLEERQAVFDESFAAIDRALVQDQTSGAIQALSGLVASCGWELRLAKFEEVRPCHDGAGGLNRALIARDLRLVYDEPSSSARIGSAVMFRSS